MNLQQLRYIVAIDRFRSFAKAAEACDVSQPTLSAMLIKLEEEIDVRIFDRTNKSVIPTSAGEKIILQAQRVLMEAGRIHEIIDEAKGKVGGPFPLSFGPTIAPYLLPQFIRFYRERYPSVDLTIRELKAGFMLDALLRGEIDAGIAISDNKREGVLEIPLYTENFYLYLSKGVSEASDQIPSFRPEELVHENMWIMKEAQCLRDSAFSFCKERSIGHHIYEAGSIETLIRIVDENGGYTIIPEMHLPFLSESQRTHVRRIEGDYLSQRRISLYIKEDYVRQAMLNSLTTTLRKFIPQRMFSERIIKYGIKL